LFRGKAPSYKKTNIHSTHTEDREIIKSLPSRFYVKIKETAKSSFFKTDSFYLI